MVPKFLSDWSAVAKLNEYLTIAEAVDRKPIERCAIDISKCERPRRKKASLANSPYLRHGRSSGLIGSHGKHRFFEEDAAVIRDIRWVQFRLGGCGVSYRDGHASVRIAQESYKGLRVYPSDLAVRRLAEYMADEFRMLQFEPIRRHLLKLLRAVNRTRREAGCEPVPGSCLRLKRRIHRPFGSPLAD